jgi:ubiquitin-conjugating enzyme E2 S
MQQVEVEGPDETPYVDRYYLLRFTFSADFPSTPPTAHFLTKVYHPNIEPTNGAVCVNTLKRDWKADHTLRHCLAVIRCLLLQPFPDSALNEDAGRLFMESYEEYCKRARLHADVHGRTVSLAQRPSSGGSGNTNSSISKASTGGGGGACENSGSSSSSSSMRVLQNSSSKNQASGSSQPSQSNSSNIVSNNNNGGGGAANSSSKKSMSSTAKSKMTKKKSLKRL